MLKNKKANAPDKLRLEGVVYTIGNAIANMKGEKKKETKVYLVKYEGIDYCDAGYGFDSIEGIYDNFEKAKDYVDNFVYEEDTSCDEVWLSIYGIKTNIVLGNESTLVYERLLFKG